MSELIFKCLVQKITNGIVIHLMMTKFQGFRYVVNFTKLEYIINVKCDKNTITI